MIYRDIPEIKARYKSKQWQKVRNLKLSIQPFCERCLANGIYKPAYIVHHKEYITDKNYFHNDEHFGKKADYMFDGEGNLIKR